MVAVRNTATMSPKRNICPKVNIYHGPIFKQGGLQCIWGQKSSGAVPFTTLFAILVLRFAVSVPLVFSGAYTGLRKDRIELPVRTNQIPRAIPDQPVNMQPITTSLVGGIWWHFALWSCVHRALLHYVLHLEPWILLLVWLLIPGAAHSPDHLFGNLDRLGPWPTFS